MALTVNFTDPEKPQTLFRANSDAGGKQARRHNFQFHGAHPGHTLVTLSPIATITRNPPESYLLPPVFG